MTIITKIELDIESVFEANKAAQERFQETYCERCTTPKPECQYNPNILHRCRNYQD